MKIHKSGVGTYHPHPKQDVARTIGDTCGYIDAGRACDECGACECPFCNCDDCKGLERPLCRVHFCEDHDCVGLSFAYVCLDGGDSLCEACAEREGVEVVPCDCDIYNTCE